MTLRQAKQLKHGDIIYWRCYQNVDGTPQRWRVNGKVKTWKTRPSEVRIPIKRGLYEYAHLSHLSLDEFTLIEQEAT